MISGVVLAAGLGARMGRPKATLTIDGERLVDRAVRVAWDGGCDEVVAVVPDGVSVPDAITVVNPDPAAGMGLSLRLGLDAASGSRAVLLLVDTPDITAESVRQVLAVDATVVVARYGGRRGHPVVVSRDLWPAVARTATGDVGARDFLAANPDLVVEVACDGDPADLDTPADLARWQSSHGRVP